MAAAELALLLGAILYEVALVKLWGQTLGKLLMGVVVVGSDARTLRWRSSLARWAVIALIPVAFGNVGGWGSWVSGGWFLVVLASVVQGKGRGLHDRVAGSHVVSFSAYRPATAWPTHPATPRRDQAHPQP
jgi:uncharacterized RDD family membrane protein YckC